MSSQLGSNTFKNTIQKNNKKDDKAAAPMTSSEEMTKIAYIRNNEEEVERVSDQIPSSSQESKES